MDLRRRICRDVESFVQHSVLHAGQARSAPCRIDAAVYYKEYKVIKLTTACQTRGVFLPTSYATTFEIMDCIHRDEFSKGTYSKYLSSKQEHRPLSSTPPSLTNSYSYQAAIHIASLKLRRSH
jgi:hypothetical protein